MRIRIQFFLHGADPVPDFFDANPDCKIIEMIIAHHSMTVFITLYVKVTGADKDKLFLVSLGALMTLFT